MSEYSIYSIDILEYAKLLIKSGVDLFIKTKKGESIFDLLNKKSKIEESRIKIGITKLIFDEISRLIKRELKELRYFWKDHPQEKQRFQQQLVSKNMVCPITGQIMVKPVQNSVRSVYDKQALQQWHQRNTRRQTVKDPLTGVEYTDRNIRFAGQKIIQIEDFLRNKLRQMVRKQQSQNQGRQRLQMMGQDVRLSSQKSSGIQQMKGHR